MTDWALSHESSSAISNEVIRLRAENERLRIALEGLLARHCDGSDERHWAEWDTVKEALEGCN